MTSEPDTQLRGGRGPLVLAIANQKGGVGKTTTAINLATALATADARTLLIDLDPQGNASTGLGLSRSARANGSYRLIGGDKTLEDVARPTLVENLSIIPADSDLAGAEIELVSESRREYRLRDALRRRRPQDQPPHDFVLIDCPPSLGLLTLNALVAADAVLVPLQCEFFALEGISQLMRTVDLVRKKLNPTLRIQGIVLTMYDRRNNLSELVAADARSFFGSQVFDTIIPRSIRVSEAPSHGKPVLLYDPKSPGAQAYGKLALELVTRDRAGQEHAA
jgi:chromosome partitioning protein